MTFLIAFFAAIFVPTSAAVVAASLPVPAAAPAPVVESDESVAANPSRHSVWAVHAAIQRIKSKGHP